MNQNDMTNEQIVEELRNQLSQVETDLIAKMSEVELLKLEKARILKEIGNHSDAKYEENLLQLVYEQRQGKKER